MVGPTLKSEGDRVDNDNYKKVGVLGMYNLPIIEWTRELVTDTPAPGMTLEPPTGAGGEDKRRKVDDKSARGDSFLEVDFAQVANCAVGSVYAAGDEVPIIPFNMNRGAICRNIHCKDPGGNVDPQSPLCSSGTSGILALVVERTLVTNSTDGLFAFQVITNGTNATAGTFSLDWLRTLAMQLYYLADPSGVYQDVVSIL